MSLTFNHKNINYVLDVGGRKNRKKFVKQIPEKKEPIIILY